MGFIELLLGESSMKTEARAAPSTSRRTGAADSRLIKAGEAVDYAMPTTPVKRRAAIDRLLRNMPAPVKRGEKPAHVLLAEERADG